MASTSPSPSPSSADNSTSPSPSNTGSSPAAPSPSVPSNSSTSSSSSSSSSSTPTPTPSSTPSDTSPSPSPSPTDSSSSSTLPSSTTASPSTTPSPTNSSTSPAVGSTDHSTSPSVTPPTVVVSTVTAPDGHTFTSTLTLPGPTDIGSHSSDTSKSASHTGAIVGGVVGGIVALLLLVLGVLLYIRHRRRLEDEAFDGNFDPDRIIRPASGPGTPRGRGPTLPNIPLTGSDERLGPQMLELDDDGMGGRLNSAAIGAGVVSPYPLYSPTSPLRSTASPPPSAGHSSDAQHSVYGAQMADWRGPSPGLSIPTQYTGGSGNSPPSSYPPSSNMAHLPPGAAPGPGGPGIAATAYGAAGFAGGRHSRRPSAGTSSSRERPIYADNGSSSAGSGDMHNGGRFGIANPDEIMGHNRSFSESARRAYIAGGPSGKSPNGPPQVPPREVLVHQDGGRIENNDNTREPEGPEEIPPTYDSILDAAGMASRSMPEKRRRF